MLVADGTRAIPLAEQVVASLANPLPLPGNRVALGVSVGIAAFSDSATPARLFRDADLAMYAAEEAGRGRYAQFEPGLHARATERLEQTAALDETIQNRRLMLFHQP